MGSRGLVLHLSFWSSQATACAEILLDPGRTHLDGRSPHGNLLGLRPRMEWGSFSQRGPRRPEEE